MPQIRFLDSHTPTSSKSILCCLLVLCLPITCLTQNETSTVPPPVPEYHCEKCRNMIEVPLAGCNSTTTIVPVCTGMCGSETKISTEIPYSVQTCQCCTSVKHRVKPRRLKFDCSGKIVTKRVYLPIVEECTCNSCAPSFGR